MPHQREAFYKAVADAQRDGMDVGFVIENDPYIQKGYDELFPPMFHAWVGGLYEMIGMVGVGYRPAENELTRLDFRAMALIKRFYEGGNGNHV